MRTDKHTTVSELLPGAAPPLKLDLGVEAEVGVGVGPGGGV